MKGSELTAVILTWNEAPNIERCLERLQWIDEVVVVDSGSDDDTAERVARWPNARLLTRPFDSHRQQWHFAVFESGIQSEWVLALDADYLLSRDLIDELQALVPDDATAAYRASFRYCIDGVPVRGALYPPVNVLFRPARGQYLQDGHTQRWQADGEVAELSAPIDHDDRKPLARWLANQGRYARLEAIKLREKSWSAMRWSDRIRRLGFVAPWLVPLLPLLRGAILSGRAGWTYALQRGIAESLIACYLFSGELSQTEAIDSTPSR